MDPNNKYTRMQQQHYDMVAKFWGPATPAQRDHVVGSFDQHNAWSDYDIYLFKNIDTTTKVALDFGCGPGRSIVKFANRFKQIDGVDISQINLDNAKVWIAKNQIAFQPILFKCDGVNLSAIHDTTYDIVYSTICMQHICVYEIRFNLIKEMFRVLKPGGHICIQMGFGVHHPKGINYHDNNYDAEGTNGYQDVMVTDPDHIKNDLITIGFSNFDFDLRPPGPGDTGHLQWIFFRAQK